MTTQTVAKDSRFFKETHDLNKEFAEITRNILDRMRVILDQIPGNVHNMDNLRNQIRELEYESLAVITQFNFHFELLGVTEENRQNLVIF